jgi:hypothetical protein
MTKTTKSDDLTVEYYDSAEHLISAACYMADPKTRRKLREHWQNEFKNLLAEHEKKFPRANLANKG